MNEDATTIAPAPNKPSPEVDLKLRESVLLEMGKALRAFSMYPPRHPQRTNLVGQVFGDIQVVLNRLGDLSYNVTRSSFIYNQNKIGENQQVIKELVQEMHLRQVKSFSLRRELILDDLAGFLEMIHEAPEKFRVGRFIEEWFRGRKIKSIWVNEMDFSHIVAMAGSEEEEKEGEEEKEEENISLARLDETLQLLEQEDDAERFGQLLRELEVLVRPYIEEGQYEIPWRVLLAISMQGSEQRRPGPAGEAVRALAVSSVHALGKGGFLSHLLSMYLNPDVPDRDSLHRVFHDLGLLVLDSAMKIISQREALRAYRPLMELIIEFGDQARAPLEAMLKGQDSIRIRKSLYLIGEIKFKESVPAIKPLLEHEDEKVRREAVRALTRIRGMDASRALVAALQKESDFEIKQVIVMALSESKDLAAVPALINVLKKSPLGEDTAPLHEAVIEALGRIGSREALPPLIKVLNRGTLFKRELAAKLRVKAALSLGRLGGESAMQALARYGRGGDDPLQKTCTAVLEALVETDGRPIENIEEYLK